MLYETDVHEIGRLGSLVSLYFGRANKELQRRDKQQNSKMADTKLIYIANIPFKRMYWSIHASDRKLISAPKHGHEVVIYQGLGINIWLSLATLYVHL